MIAQNTTSEGTFLALWLIGGVVTLAGALCYAELGATYPSTGGEYHFLHRAYGQEPAFLFAWGRMMVMQSGSIAAAAFVFGDYASVLLPAGPHGPALHATLAVTVLSTLQLLGTEQSTRTQLALTIATLAVVLVVAAVGLTVPSQSAPPSQPPMSGPTGLAMVFILLTYGGWSEAAYLSGEVRDPARDIPRVLFVGTVLVTLLYLLVNYAYLTALGFDGLRQSDVVAADVAALALGERSAAVVAGAVCLASLSTLNATILTGARSIYALGKSFSPFAILGRSDVQGKSPRNAIFVQLTIVFGLILLGALTRHGFQSTVEYTAPVFWTFMLLIGVSLFAFRWRDPNRETAFRVPFFPLTPLLFCATSLYLLYSSLIYTGWGGLIGMAIFAVGIPIYRFGRQKDQMRRVTRSGDRKS